MAQRSMTEPHETLNIGRKCNVYLVRIEAEMLRFYFIVWLCDCYFNNIGYVKLRTSVSVIKVALRFMYIPRTTIENMQNRVNQHLTVGSTRIQVMSLDEFTLPLKFYVYIAYKLVSKEISDPFLCIMSTCTDLLHLKFVRFNLKISPLSYFHNF